LAESIDESGSQGSPIRAKKGILTKQTFAAFELRDFRLLWGNNFSYALVQGIQRFAFVWLAGDLSKENLVLGLVTFGLGIPVFFLTLPSGVLSDRWDRRRLLFLSQFWVLATSLLTAILIWTGAMGVPMAIGMAILIGVGVAVGQPVRQALVPAVVPQNRLMNAITLNSLGQNVSQIIGPLIGGAAIDIWGNGGGFALQAVLMGIGLIFLVPLKVPEAERVARIGRQLLKEMMGEIREGFSFVKGAVDIRTLFFLLLASSLVIMGPWQALLPRVAEEQLGAEAFQTGVLFGAMGVGTVISSLILASIPRLENAGGWFTVTLITGGSLAVGIGLSHNYLLTVLFMFASGLNAGFFINLNLTLIQAHTPSDVMGRVMAIYTLVLMGGSPFGGLMAGGGAQLIGAGEMFALSGAAVAIVASVFLVTQPTLRRMPSHPEEQEERASG
tara:strand:- start:12491 stop:13819 length:1329 start_codon:yes stop_codon:yes gene_type:complete